jgi:hypothetical protein
MIRSDDLSRHYGKRLNVPYRIRILLGILILAISISLLIWGFAPMRREVRTQPVSPADLQLPTPESFRFDTPWELSASPSPFEFGS